jgi:hypothetical protein
VVEAPEDGWVRATDPRSCSTAPKGMVVVPDIGRRRRHRSIPNLKALAMLAVAVVAGVSLAGILGRHRRQPARAERSLRITDRYRDVGLRHLSTVRSACGAGSGA